MSLISEKPDLKDLIGRPYETGGRGPASYDCWGLCMAAAEKMGHRLPELEIPNDLDLRRKLVTVQRQAKFRRMAGPKAGSLALFRIIDDENQIRWHVGLVLFDTHKFIHTTEKMGANISRLDRQPWKLFIEGFYEPRA